MTFNSARNLVRGHCIPLSRQSVGKYTPDWAKEGIYSNIGNTNGQIYFYKVSAERGPN